MEMAWQRLIYPLDVNFRTSKIIGDKTMTREEEIRNAVDTTFPIPPSEKGRTYEQALMATGFENGVKWADTHPKSPWVSVKESLPKEDPERNDYMSVEVLTITDKGYIKLDTYDHQNQVWFIHSEILFDEDDSLGKVTHWMYISKLPANENV